MLLIMARPTLNNTKYLTNEKPVVQKASAVALPPAEQPQMAVAAPVAASPPPVSLDDHDQLMSLAGISQNDWPAVDYIVSHESGWCPFKWEGEIGSCPAFHGVSDYDGYGLCQSTPPQKMAVAGDDWETNTVTQLKWCSSYAASRYGGWWASYDHWVAHRNW